MQRFVGFLAACIVSAIIAGAIVYDLPSFTRSGMKPKETASIGVGGLQVCAAHDKRTPVPLWSPSLTEKGDLTEEPPQEEGQVVFIEILGDDDKIGCGSAAEDHLYSLSKPTNAESALDGGLAVNLRGHVQFHNGLCTFHGFYMNQPVYGMHQGWTETYFKPLDQFEIIKSGTYCSEKPVPH